MDSINLSIFYRSLATWPRNLTELSAAADKVRKLLDVPVAGIWIHDLGIRLVTGQIPGAPNVEALGDYIKSQIDRMPNLSLAPQNGNQPALKQLHLASEAPVPSLNGNPVDRLAVIPVFAQDRHEIAWVIAISDKPCGDRKEVLLTSIAQHLSHLAICQRFESEISIRDQFLSIASHELKTPLTSIYGILQLQERMLRPKTERPQTPEQEKQHGFFKIVIRQVERLNELIDGLLDVSRIQNGRFVVESSDSDASALLKETVDSRLGLIAQEAGVKIQVDAPASLMAWLDPVRFEEVVTNLGMNAIRFSPEGGVVWIRLREDADKIALSFRDQGPALHEADRARIFQPFERAQRTTRLGGLGLGLFISRQIAQLHGGDVLLTESIAGKGNLFEAVFPIRKIQKISA